MSFVRDRWPSIWVLDNVELLLTIGWQSGSFVIKSEIAAYFIDLTPPSKLFDCRNLIWGIFGMKGASLRKIWMLNILWN